MGPAVPELPLPWGSDVGSSSECNSPLEPGPPGTCGRKNRDAEDWTVLKAERGYRSPDDRGLWETSELQICSSFRQWGQEAGPGQGRPEPLDDASQRQDSDTHTGLGKPPQLCSHRGADIPSFQTLQDPVTASVSPAQGTGRSWELTALINSPKRKASPLPPRNPGFLEGKRFSEKQGFWKDGGAWLGRSERRVKWRG
ncbi:hypothetical protein H8959_003222 [Pygathrix nigripes]